LRLVRPPAAIILTGLLTLDPLQRITLEVMRGGLVQEDRSNYAADQREDSDRSGDAVR
jgi:hypothetical protein